MISIKGSIFSLKVKIIYLKTKVVSRGYKYLLNKKKIKNKSSMHAYTHQKKAFSL